MCIENNITLVVRQNHMTWYYK